MLSVENALELLDYAYADATVRNFAVKCLAGIRYGLISILFYCINNGQAYIKDRCDMIIDWSNFFGISV